MTGRNEQPSIVIIGAGSTGRGHLGILAYEAGFRITFIERRQDLVDCLKTAGRYSVGLAGETITAFEVDGFKVLHTSEMDECAEAIANTDIVATAVIPTNLESTVPTLAAGLSLRMRNGIEKPLNIIAAENMERSSSTLRKYLKEISSGLDWNWIDEHVGFPDSMIARAVPVPEDPLVLLAEYTQEWSIDANAIKQPMPYFEGITLCERQDAALERKLYIKNTGHMSIGVLGYLKGYTLMHEAANDPEIFDLVDCATSESASAVIAKHGFPLEETEKYRKSFLTAMRSPFLPDEITRVVRQPIRKLSREERLVGPAMLAYETGHHPEALAKVIASTLKISIPGDAEAAALQEMLGSQDISTVITKICGIHKGHPLAALIERNYR